MECRMCEEILLSTEMNVSRTWVYMLLRAVLKPDVGSLMAWYTVAYSLASGYATRFSE